MRYYSLDRQNTLTERRKEELDKWTVLMFECRYLKIGTNNTHDIRSRNPTFSVRINFTALAHCIQHMYMYNQTFSFLSFLIVNVTFGYLVIEARTLFGRGGGSASIAQVESLSAPSPRPGLRTRCSWIVFPCLRLRIPSNRVDPTNPSSLSAAFVSRSWHSICHKLQPAFR